jgi:hypothetical protein
MGGAQRNPSPAKLPTKKVAIGYPHYVHCHRRLFPVIRTMSRSAAIGDDRFLARIERLTKRILKPGKRGPKPVDD